MLREVPTRRSAFVAGEEHDGQVPVMVAISTSNGMVTGELTIPAERWSPASFLQFLGEMDERKPS
jgi:hypothetical protein